MYDVATRHLDAQRYVSRTSRLLVPELEPFIREAFAEHRTGAADAPPFVLYHGPVNHEEDGPVEACVPRADGDKELPAGEVAWTAIAGAQCEFPEILGAYDAVYRWAREHGRDPAGPPREIYLGGLDEPLRLEIALPLSG